MDITGIIETIRELFSNLQAGPFMIVAIILYLAIQVLRGKAGFNIPWVTEKFNSIESAAIKTYILMGLFGLAGGFTALGNSDAPTVWVFFDGLLAGFTVGSVTVGTRHVVKTTLETSPVQNLKNKVLKVIKKEDVEISSDKD